MYYLLVEINKTIIDINNEQPVKVEKDDYMVWRSSNKDDIMDDNYTCVEVENIPDGLIPHKYCYDNGEFTLNPNYSENNIPLTLVRQMETMVLKLFQNTNNVASENIKINEFVTNMDNIRVESELDIDYRVSMLELGLV